MERFSGIVDSTNMFHTLVIPYHRYECPSYKELWHTWREQVSCHRDFLVPAGNPKLKSFTLPWEEKLQLVRNVWHSADCVMPHNPQVLLDWLCQELINAHRRNARFASTTANGAMICVHINLFLIQKAVHVTSCEHNVFMGTPQLCATNLHLFTSLAPSELLVNLLLIYFNGLIVIIQYQFLFSEYSVFLGMNMM